MTPTITAVIPTYRRPGLLRRAIESVLAQTRTDLTVAVFDNASGDETAETVAELSRRDPRVTYHCHPSNLGAIANFQAGMDAVRTPFFSFLSDDDLLLPDFYARAINHLEQNREARFFCGQTLVYEPETGRYHLRPTKIWDSGRYEPGQGVTRMLQEHFTWTSVLFATEVRSGAGPLLDQAICDIPFQVCAAALYPFIVSLEPCAVFTSHAGAESGQLDIDAYARCYQAGKRCCTALPDLEPEIAQAIERGFDRRLLRAAGRQVREAFRGEDWGELDGAVKILQQGPGLDRGQRLYVALARQRQARPWLYRTLRRLLLLRRQQRSGRAKLPTAPSAEALVARFAGIGDPI